jgi:hypothetical protein
MSGGQACRDQAHKPHWVVWMRKHNRSAFNGYRYAPSAYSLIQCPVCLSLWRSKAAFVDQLPDRPRESAG